MNTLIGQQWGNYRLLRLLGRGGFAEVYLGEHVRLGMHGAIKILHTVLSEEVFSAFQQEAQVIVELAHPHIVRLLDFDIKDARPFLVLEYAPGGSLSQKHPAGTIVPLPLVVDYINQIAKALQYAHGKKVIHRDIKPGNMLINAQNQILLSDFGIATIAHSTSSTDIQKLTGTLHYMAPEQIHGYARAASDQYALGIVAYQWLSGVRPFQGSPGEVIAQHLEAQPRALRELVPQIQQEVAQVVYTAMAKDSRERFESVLAFANALQQAAQNRSEVSQHVDSVPTTPVRASLTVPLLTSPLHVASASISRIGFSAQLEPFQASLEPNASNQLFASNPSASPAQTPLTITPPAPPIPVSPASASQISAPAAAVDEQQAPPTSSTLVSQIEQSTVKNAFGATTQRRTRTRTRSKYRAFLFATASILLVGSACLWCVFAFSHQAKIETPQPVVSMKSAHVNVTITSGELGRTVTAGIPGFETTPTTTITAGHSSPTVQPTDRSTSSPGSPIPTPSIGPDCIQGSTNSFTATGLLGGSTSKTVTLTNCSLVMGHWTATRQLDNGSNWTSCSPISGDIAANGTQDVQIIMDSSSLPVGTYTGQWTFTMGSSSWVVHIKLVVLP